MDENAIVILGILGNDKNIIPYRKELNKITGGIIETLVLQQFIYWWNAMEHKPFYKFIEPCNHKEYKEGDSWTEELGISKFQFTNAFKKLSKLNLVSKKTNSQRLTYYSLNTEILAKLIKLTYLSKETSLSKCNNLTYLSEETSFTSITETTTETTQRETTSRENSNFPFFEEEFGKDEESNTIGKPSLNQVRAEAKRQKIEVDVATSFWLHQESVGWRGVIDWVAKLRKWAMDEKKFTKSTPKATEEKLKEWASSGRNRGFKVEFLGRVAKISDYGVPYWGDDGDMSWSDKQSFFKWIELNWEKIESYNPVVEKCENKRSDGVGFEEMREFIVEFLIENDGKINVLSSLGKVISIGQDGVLFGGEYPLDEIDVEFVYGKLVKFVESRRVA